jgi:hypothetical protein
MPNISLLTQTTTPADAHVWDSYISDFTGALCTNGYTSPLPQQTGTDLDSYKTGAQNLMDGGADVIVTAGNVAANACYEVTEGSDTFVVVASAGDLTGLTGGNLTGCTNGQFDQNIVQARVNRMQGQLNPTEVGVVGNYDLLGTAMDDVITALGAIPAPGHPLVGHIVDVNPTNFKTANDLKGILTDLKKQYPNVNVLYVCSDPYLRTNGNILVQGAHNHPVGRFSTMHEFGEWVTHHGGDRAYGPNFNQLFQRAAGYVDQILNGALPANLPVFAPNLVDCVPTP